MIHPRAIERFLNRPTANHDWIKDCKNWELSEALDELDPVPYFSKDRPPYKHQKACFLLLHELRYFMLFLDMGLGKTAICLDQVRYRKDCGLRPRAIVFVPYLTSANTWIDEVKDWYNDLDLINLDGTSDENFKRLTEEDADVYVMCYQSAVAMLTETMTVRKKGKKAKTKWVLDPKFVQNVFRDFDMLIMDEIQQCRNIHSLTFRMCRAISKQVDCAYGLTGTPFGRDILALWPEFYLVDMGETLGDTLGLFRSAFFIEKENFWGGYKYKFKKKLEPKLYNMIKHSSIRYEEKECFDMPPLIKQVKHVQFPQDIKSYYERALSDLQDLMVSKKKNYKAIESNYMQLRQLSSGFMTFKGEDNDRVKIVFPDNPKLEALMELVEDLPPNRKMIVFHDFVFTNQLISEALTKAKIKHCRIYGKTSKANKLKEVERFKNDPDYRVALINSQSGSTSLNLQVANYLVFYECPASVINRKQAIKRPYRGGQTRRVFMWDLVMRGTADEQMLKYHEQGEALFDAIMDGRTRPWLKRSR